MKTSFLFVCTFILYLLSGCNDGNLFNLYDFEISEFSEDEQLRIKNITNTYNVNAEFQNSINRFAAADTVTSGEWTVKDIIFTGSSSITLWTTLEQDMQPFPVLNRGFGGSGILDIIYYSEEVIFKYHPKIVVLYVENDIVRLPVSDILLLFRYFESILHKRLPDCKLIFLSLKQSQKRKEVWAKVDELNREFEILFSNKPGCRYVDVASCLLNDVGEPDESFFRPDKLHLSALAYEKWKTILFDVLTIEYASNVPGITGY